jgi:hypothetical protein
MKTLNQVEIEEVNGGDAYENGAAVGRWLIDLFCGDH